MQQGSKEWLEFRKGHVMASDAPVIMGFHGFKTPYQLWQEKLGLWEPVKNEAMRYGNENESVARSMYEEMVGLFVQPAVVMSLEVPWMGASLDGISKEGVIVEIKCSNGVDHERAVAGGVPDKYVAQLQHQMFVANCSWMHYFSFHKGKGVVVEVTRDNDFISNMLEKEKAFWDKVQQLEEPELVEQDYQEMGEEWCLLARQLHEIKQTSKDITQREKSIEAQLRALSGDRNCRGDGYRYSLTYRKGSVNYDQIPQLEGVVLDGYRKPSTPMWRLTKA